MRSLGDSCACFAHIEARANSCTGLGVSKSLSLTDKLPSQVRYTDRVQRSTVVHVSELDEGTGSATTLRQQSPY